jgi:hypothetical protein
MPKQTPKTTPPANSATAKDASSKPASVLDANGFNPDLEQEVQTDKAQTKVVPCKTCGRPLVVSTFYAEAKARCSSCRGDASAKGVATVTKATIDTPQEKAVDLRDILINPQFGEAFCPLDPGHTMELKSVTHNPNYGPTKIVAMDKGKPVYNVQTGEVVTHQCAECNTVVSFGTTHPIQLRRANEPKVAASKQPPALLWLLGPRLIEEENAA